MGRTVPDLLDRERLIWSPAGACRALPDLAKYDGALARLPATRTEIEAMRRLAAALTAITLAITFPAPASAATQVFRDRVGDVASDVDLVRVRVQNGSQLVLTSKHVDLSRQAFQSVAFYIDVDGNQRGPEFLVAGGFPGSEWIVRHTRGWRAVGNQQTCRSNATFAYDRDFVRFRLSRSCLDRDRGHVRASVVAARARADNSSVRDWLGSRHHFSSWVPFQ